jgi:hypothetical protein
VKHQQCQQTIISNETKKSSKSVIQEHEVN